MVRCHPLGRGVVLLRKTLVLGTVGGLLLMPGWLLGASSGPRAIAQEGEVEAQENSLIERYALPSDPAPAPVYQPAPAPPVYDPGPVYEEPQPAYDPQPVYEEPQPVYPDSEDPQPAYAPDMAPVEPVPGGDRDPLPEQIAEPAAATAQSDSNQAASGDAKEANVGPLSRYVLEFNRSPIVGNSLRLQGVYAERRLGFNRPTSWKVKTAQALIRYQNSPDLLPDRSNLTIRVNGTSIGSVPLQQKKSEIGEVLVDIPVELIQDYNEIVLVAQQNNDKACSNPADPALWTEILPDSKLILGYQTQSVPLAFENFPYPFFDRLALDPSSMVYAQPKQVDKTWLTAASRFQAGMGRQAAYRPLKTRVLSLSSAKETAKLAWNESLVVLGTPASQPLLESLKLPFKLNKGQVLDGKGKLLPGDVGVLMLTTTNDGKTPVLVATGNGDEGVLKAVQLLQTQDSAAIGSGQGILVESVSTPTAPAPRDWPQHLPQTDEFRLSNLKQANGEAFQDTTVRTSATPPIEIDFRALPDDHFLRGNTMQLEYSYGPQLDPRRSTVEVTLDDVAIAGKRLTKPQGATREKLNVTLPENLIKPDSKLRISFQLSPNGGGDCGIMADRQLWATLHSDTRFDLKREQSVDLPNLKLLQVGYPFAAPQDLSATTLVVPDDPSAGTLLTLLEMSERLGRLSASQAIEIEAVPVADLSETAKQEDNLIAIGPRDRFPLQEALSGGTLALGPASSRQIKADSTPDPATNPATNPGTQIQTLADRQGIIKQILSPWNRDRVVLALAAQGETGLNTLQQFLENDIWFFQLDGDTVLISANAENPLPYDPRAYEFKVLRESQTRRIATASLLSRSSRFIQERWFILPTAVFSLCLLMYGISQISLKRVDGEDS